MAFDLWNSPWTTFPLGKPSSHPTHIISNLVLDPFQLNISITIPKPHQKIVKPYETIHWHPPSSTVINSLDLQAFAGADGGGEGHDIGFENVGLHHLVATASQQRGSERSQVMIRLYVDYPQLCHTRATYGFYNVIYRSYSMLNKKTTRNLRITNLLTCLQTSLIWFHLLSIISSHVYVSPLAKGEAPSKECGLT